MWEVGCAASRVALSADWASLWGIFSPSVDLECAVSENYSKPLGEIFIKIMATRCQQKRPQRTYERWEQPINSSLNINCTLAVNWAWLNIGLLHWIADVPHYYYSR